MMEQSIEFMTGVCFTILGLSLFLRTTEWSEWASHLKARGAKASIVIGMVNLLLGSFILAFHWVWEGLAMIVTVFGVLFIFRSIVLLMFPNVFPYMLARMTSYFKCLFKVAGAVVFILGSVLLYDWNLQMVLLNAAS
jgi:uncharacterized protein YjeT (DUF2065 family)